MRCFAPDVGMTGIIKIASGDYIFRDDTSYSGVWGWNMHNDPGFSGHVPTHKWPKLPSGAIEIFDIESPPATVGYQPLLAAHI